MPVRVSVAKPSSCGGHAVGADADRQPEAAARLGDGLEAVAARLVDRGDDDAGHDAAAVVGDGADDAASWAWLTPGRTSRAAAASQATRPRSGARREPDPRPIVLPVTCVCMVETPS